MTANGRTDLIQAAAESIAETRWGLDDDAKLHLNEAAGFAVDGVLAALYPTEAARNAQARLVFEDQWLSIESAWLDCAFAVGVAYGRLVAKVEGR